MTKMNHILCLAALSISTSGVALAQSAQNSAPPANASAVVNISPLRVDMASTVESEQMLLRNESNQPLTVQLRMFGWNQAEGKDSYAPSQDFLVSPSIITVAPQSTQTLHVVPNSQRDEMTERTYRVVLDQIINKQGQAPGMAQTRLRMTVPLFSGGEKASAADLSYVVKGNRLYITNNGGRAAVLPSVNIQFGAPQSAEVPLEGSPRYVLSRSTMSVAMPAAFQCDGKPVTVSGMIGRKPFHAVATQNCT